jgi:hypothetical protein
MDFSRELATAHLNSVRLMSSREWRSGGAHTSLLQLVDVVEDMYGRRVSLGRSGLYMLDNFVDGMT